LKPLARTARVFARPVMKRFGLSEGALGENWAEIAGPDWACVTAPRHLNHHSQTLTVRVAGARAVELAHMDAILIERINSFAGRQLVKRLKLVQGPVLPPRDRPPAPKPLSPEAEAAIAASAAHVADSRLQAALQTLGRAIKSR
jgi:hypothetical protein